MAEAVKEAMRKEDFALRRLSKQIRLCIKELPASGLRARGPDGVLEELEGIKRDRVTFIQLVEDYEENYHRVEDEVIPVIGDVRHDVQFWNEEGEKLIDEVGTHRTSILNELQLMKKEETQAINVVEEAEKREKRNKEMTKIQYTMILTMKKDKIKLQSENLKVTGKSVTHIDDRKQKSRGNVESFENSYH